MDLSGINAAFHADNPTMTPEEAAAKIRALGVKVSPDRIRNGIRQGAYPFGDCVMMDKLPSFTIYTKLFDLWVEERFYSQQPKGQPI